MSEPGVTELLSEIKDLQATIAVAERVRLEKLVNKADKAELSRIADDMATKYGQLRTAVDGLSLKLGRPGGGGNLDASATTLRASARGLLELKQNMRVTKSSPDELPFMPAEDELAEAEHAIRGMKHLMKCSSLDQLPAIERKSLSSFSMGASGFIVQPEMSNKVLSCLTDPTDLSGLVGSVAISSASIKFLVDHVRLQNAGWACDASCAANSPAANFTEGLGELEIKAEPLRYVVCSSRDILEDATFDGESWMLQKVALAFRNALSDAILAGDGVGRPQGILHPASGVPVCDTSINTPAGQFVWQDLVSVKFQVPLQYHAGAVWVMNQVCFGQMLTMSDAIGRPLLIANPTLPGEYLLVGSPIRSATQMPPVMPGSTPILFGNLQIGYLLVYRKQLTMLQDPYSMGFCVVFRFESRVGGNVACANSMRLLRIK
jgi:HK97 family phage major capsid protein